MAITMPTVLVLRTTCILVPRDGPLDRTAVTVTVTPDRLRR